MLLLLIFKLFDSQKIKLNESDFHLLSDLIKLFKSYSSHYLTLKKKEPSFLLVS